MGTIFRHSFSKSASERVSERETQRQTGRRRREESRESSPTDVAAECAARAFLHRVEWREGESGQAQLCQGDLPSQLMGVFDCGLSVVCGVNTCVSSVLL